MAEQGVTAYRQKNFGVHVVVAVVIGFEGRRHRAKGSTA